jgi:hypothetical protein
MEFLPIPAIPNFANLVVYPAKQEVSYDCFKYSINLILNLGRKFHLSSQSQ